MGKKRKNKGGKHSHYLTPGVYLEEVSSGSRPIEGVGTAVAAFVGISPFSLTRLARAVALAAALTFVVKKVR